MGMQHSDRCIRLVCSASTVGALGSGAALLTGADGSFSGKLSHAASVVSDPQKRSGD
jgi:hypothetical protein